LDELNELTFFFSWGKTKITIVGRTIIGVRQPCLHVNVGRQLGP